MRGSPSAIFLPKFRTISRSTTARSACTTCSIHTIVTPPPAHVADRRDQRAAFGLGQPAGDLVEEQDARLGGERARKLQALALEQRQRAGAAIGERQQAGPSRISPQRSRRLPNSPRSLPCVAPTRRFSKTVMLAKGCGIWNERAMPARARACGERGGDVAAVEADRAGIGLQRTGDQVEERGLSGAVRPDDAERVAGFDGKIDTVRDDDRAEGFGQALKLEDHRGIRLLQNGRHARA